MLDTKREVKFITINREFADTRIDNFLMRELKGVPRQLIYKLIRKDEIRVNKKRIKPEYRLQEDDVIRIAPIHIKESEEISVPKKLQEFIKNSIIYDDKDLLIINKPTSIAVHGGSGLSFGVIEILRAIYPNANLELVHRLDRETSGLLMVAKKRSVLKHLNESLANKTITKKYLAIVEGEFDNKDKIVNVPLLKVSLNSGERIVKVDDEGKKSTTHFKVIERFGKTATLIEAEPKTGRTHQIRVHCKWTNHPILGDEKYNMHTQIPVKRLCLHAYKLKLTMPNGDVREFEATTDEKWQNILEDLRGNK